MFFIALFPIFAAFISWLFFKVFSLFFIQSVSKQKKDIANKFALFIQDQNFEKIIDIAISQEKIQALAPEIESQLNIFLEQKLVQKMPIMSMVAGDKFMIQAKEIALDEIMKALPVLVKQYAAKELNAEKLGEVVKNEIILMTNDQLQVNVNTLLKPFISKLQFASLVLGFILGVSYILFMFLYNFIFNS